MKRIKADCITRKVMEFLEGRDDFATAREISEGIHESKSRVTAALYHLNQHKAVDFVEGKRLHWFATPSEDTRFRPMLERAIETQPRRRRKVKPLRREACGE